MGGKKVAMNKVITLIRESRVARFLIPVGIMLVAFGIIFFVVNKRNQNYVETEASVTKVELEQEAYKDSNGDWVDATYILSIKYTADGKEYEAELNGMPESKEGQKLTIYYNPSDPGQITQTKSLVIPLIIIGIGIAALAGGVISGVNAAKRIGKMKDQEKEWENG